MASKNKHQQQQQKKEPVTLVGIVKAVHSGDSIVVYNQQGQEKELFFSNIKAPVIARNDNQTDEDWAFQSREFLRKLVIGQQVSFTIEHKTERGREYGSASMGSTNIIKEIVANGWATVKLPEDGKKARNELHEELIALYHQAENDGIGIFQKPTKASVRHFPKANDQSRLFEEIKGSHSAVVEYIRDGSSFRVLLPSLHRVYIKISGAEAPRIPRDLKVEPAPAYALEAKSFVEKHLLHRDVNVTVRSPGDSDSEFYGTLSFKGRDVAEELIRNGYAKFVAWNAPPQNKETLQALENQAKQSKLRIWKSFSGQPANNNNVSKNQLVGKIREIRDAANLAIVDTSVNPPRRVQITLSSIQAPRFGVKDKGDEEYGYEAKEYVRKNFIGKKVRAELDFKREAIKGVPGKPDLPEKEFWSVYCGDVNLAVALVENGLVKVAKGNSKDGRSPAYEELIIAEKSAQAANKNLWNKNKTAPVHNYSDLTLQSKEAKQRAKQFLPFFQRQPNAKIPAVVEYVLSPNRLKVYVPKENCMIVLGFEGIRTPKNSPIYDEAFEYVRDKLQQRDIHISVDNLDKVGSFIGVVYSQKKNFGLTLVEMGYATVSDTVDYSPIAADYRDAETRAKEAKRKLWQYEVEVNQVEDQSSNIIEIEEKKPKLISVTISEIIDASNFFIHVEEEKEALDQLMNELNSFNVPLPPLNYAPKHGEIAIAKFSDKKWYRVKILSTSPPNYTLLYIDYGNTEPMVNIKDIRPIPAQFMQRPPFAKECFLAYLSLPTGNDEYADEAAEYFHHLLWGKQLYATIEYKEGDKVFVAIGDGKFLANVALTSAGYALVNKRVRNPDSIIVKTLREEQERARAKRNGRWEYGDFENDD